MVQLTLVAVDGLGNTVDFSLTVRVNPGEPVVKHRIPDMSVAQGETVEFQMELDTFEMYSPAGSFTLTAEVIVRQVRVHSDESAHDNIAHCISDLSLNTHRFILLCRKVTSRRRTPCRRG